MLLPDALNFIDWLLLIGGSFFGSLLTASLGVGGGAFLIVVMAGIVPPLALIPLHGVVQLGSNSARAFHTRRHVQFDVVGFFLLGAFAACFSAIYILDIVNADYIPVIAVACILILTWMPMPKLKLGQHPVGLLSGGLVTTMASMMMGASGPLVSAWLSHSRGDRWIYTANFSSCMTLQHLLKVVVFGWVGFAFVPWVTVLLMMLIAGYLGTRVGLLLLGKLPEKVFRQLFKWVLTLLALRVFILFLSNAINT